jgi:hypothetical protein
VIGHTDTTVDDDANIVTVAPRMSRADALQGNFRKQAGRLFSPSPARRRNRRRSGAEKSLTRSAEINIVWCRWNAFGSTPLHAVNIIECRMGALERGMSRAELGNVRAPVRDCSIAVNTMPEGDSYEAVQGVEPG